MTTVAATIDILFQLFVMAYSMILNVITKASCIACHTYSIVLLKKKKMMQKIYNQFSLREIRIMKFRLWFDMIHFRLILQYHKV